MKTLKILKFCLIMALGLSFSNCGNTDSSNDSQSEEASIGHDHGEGAAFSSAFVCPMHCEGSGSEVAGNCPACGMNYIAIADHVSDGHSHNENDSNEGNQGGESHTHEDGTTHEHN